jgi:predicted N-acyltransferase
MGMFSLPGCVEKKPSLFKAAACGNMFVSGGNGYCINAGENRQEVIQQLTKSIQQAIKTDEWEDSNVVTLIKDLPSTNTDYKHIGKPYQALSMEPIMQLDIRGNWLSFEDYLNDLNTKFRTKAKSAYKKSGALKCVNMNESDIRNHLKELSQLYETVEQKAEFRFAALNLQSFLQLKKLYKKQFIVQAYFLENKLVGFLSAFQNNEILDANYVGIDYNLNHQYAIYPRMLYDYIQLAIDRRVKVLSYGRTASEIKSTVGAVPVDAKCYINYGGLLTSKLIKNFVEGVELPNWEQRVPFKKIVLETA